MRTLFLGVLVSMATAGCGSACDEACMEACDAELVACSDALEEGDDATECSDAWAACIEG